MVAPSILNRPTRVFARLTFTGEEKNSPPVCCDLSRVASIVPANPLPVNLNSGDNSRAPPVHAMQCITKDEKLSVLCNDNQKISIPHNAADNSNFNKDTDDPKDEDKNSNASPKKPATPVQARRKRAREDDAEIVSQSPIMISSVTPAAAESPNRNEMHHIDALVSENEILKQENRILNQKVLAFQRILSTEPNFEHARKKIKALELTVLA
ncbi:uncharacterized protein LOC108682936 [Hyalella azteca]|uniref:Uncharacterized protein LOC108682936 n=1 Tax=Hyalella azteca TaxID=294128 RepID=A0A8B7PNW5_HYAAZ|nr:uncharacterized protein LOC108682936 [Hyalella azteca]